MMNKYRRRLLIALVLIIPIVILTIAIGVSHGWTPSTNKSQLHENTDNESLITAENNLQDTKSGESANKVVSAEEASRVYTIDDVVSLSKHIIKGEVVNRQDYSNNMSEFDVRVIKDYGQNIEYIKNDMIRVYVSRWKLEEGKTYYMFLQSIEYDWFPNRLYLVAHTDHSFIEVGNNVSTLFMGSKNADAYKEEILLTEEIFIERMTDFYAPKDLSSPNDKVMLTSDEMNVEQAIEAADVCAIGKVVKITNEDKYSDHYSIVLTRALKGEMILYSEEDVQLMIDSKYEPWFQRVFI